MARTQMVQADNLISLTEAADRLGVHYMTAYRYVRTGRLHAVKDGHEWQVAAHDVDDLKRGLAGGTTGGGAAPSVDPPRQRRGRTAYKARLVDRLIRSDEGGAWALVETAMTGGMDAAAVYLELLAPALDEIGGRWERGEISVADEHRASAIVLRLVGRLGPRFARRGRKRGTIVLGAPAGERHGLPSALLRDLLRGEGYEVIDLGADVPADSWAATVAATPRLLAVGLCATTEGNDEGLAAAVTAIRSVTGTPIVIGGRAVDGPEHVERLGGTAYSGDFAEAVAAFHTVT